MPCAISVIIPTWNRRELVREAVRSFWSQTIAPDSFEVIVVDNCSTDGTGDIFPQLIAEAPFRLVYHRMPENRGPVRSRNTGAAMASAPLLAFTDSDCRVSPQWLEAALEAARCDPGAAFFAGAVRNKPEQRVSFFSLGGTNIDDENPIYPTCNIVYRAEVFHRVGGFDENIHLFDAGGAPVECSDADLAWRLKGAGYRSVFVPEQLIYHEVRRTTPYEWLAAHGRMMLIPELVRRHAGLRRRLLWWGPFCLPENLLFYVALAGLAAAPWQPWALAAALPFVGRVLQTAARSSRFWQLPKMFGQLAFLSMRQVVICGALVCGSVRARRLVL